MELYFDPRTGQIMCRDTGRLTSIRMRAGLFTGMAISRTVHWNIIIYMKKVIWNRLIVWNWTITADRRCWLFIHKEEYRYAVN